MRRKLSGKLAMIFAAAVLGAAAGCSALPKYSVVRTLAGDAAGRAASHAVPSFVIGGSSAGRKLGEKAVEQLLGPDIAYELEIINKKGRFKYGVRGLPVCGDFWFKFVGLDPKIQADKDKIDFVETVARQAKLFPEEVMLVVGINSRFTIRQLEEERLPQLERALGIAAGQINEIENDLNNNFFTKTGPRKKVLKQLGNLSLFRECLATEHSAIKNMLELGKLMPGEFNGLMDLGRNGLQPQMCRRGIVTFISSRRD